MSCQSNNKKLGLRGNLKNDVVMLCMYCIPSPYTLHGQVICGHKRLQLLQQMHLPLDVLVSLYTGRWITVLDDNCEHVNAVPGYKEKKTKLKTILKTMLVCYRLHSQGSKSFYFMSPGIKNNRHRHKINRLRTVLCSCFTKSYKILNICIGLGLYRDINAV